MYRLSIPFKRRHYFENWVLNRLDKEGLKVYSKLLGKEKNARLDSVLKKELPFPKILNPQRNMPVEWWYFTGHLQSRQQRFGYEFCFFKFHPLILRFGPLPLNRMRKEPFLVLHFALTDKSNNKFDFVQESGLAEPQVIHYDNLKLSVGKSSLNFKDKFTVSAITKIGDLRLELKPETGIVKHFSSGYAEMLPGHRTYYLSYPRLSTKGKLAVGKKAYAVKGTSWFDHQKMNFRHHSPLKGWEWFSINFDDKTELMFFVLRNSKGLTRNHLGGTYIDKEGKISNLEQSDAEIKTLADWKSPHTGVVYPSGWRMRIKRLGLDVKIIPEVKDQEMKDRAFIPITYWEGACKVAGMKKGRKISGQSYVELTGYDKRLSTKILESMVD
jgi:predicted secreted hydrolase